MKLQMENKYPLYGSFVDKLFNRMPADNCLPFYTNGLFERNVAFFAIMHGTHGPFWLSQFNNKGLVAVWRIQTKQFKPVRLPFWGPVYVTVGPGASF